MARKIGVVTEEMVTQVGRVNRAVHVAGGRRCPHCHWNTHLATSFNVSSISNATSTSLNHASSGPSILHINIDTNGITTPAIGVSVHLIPGSSVTEIQVSANLTESSTIDLNVTFPGSVSATPIVITERGESVFHIALIFCGLINISLL